ncbi:hypothetical protein G9A89_009000 [Geosiphon pyriformis]|nr:hypothetical protein G9A89_009000 [Geosiphon pyriformis]
MNMTASPGFLWKAGAVLGATGVIFGAFGAHTLKKSITDAATLKIWETAATYQIIHATAILYLSNTRHPVTGRPPLLSGSLILAGTVLFSGSLYLIVLNKARFRFLGPTTPLGGLLMIAGWINLAF